MDRIEERGVAVHARVAFGLESLLHFVAEGAHEDGVSAVGGEVFDALGIFGDVVELFGGALAEGEFVEVVEAGDDLGLRRGVVDVAVAGFGVAGGPGVGGVVADVEPLFGADGADGVAGVVGAAEVVAL